jgi:seryl-tRNA synthetase
MLEINYLRNSRDEALTRLDKRMLPNAAELVDKAIELDEIRRSTQAQLDAKQAEMNLLSKSIGVLMKEGKHDEAVSAKTGTAQLKEEIHLLREQMDSADTSLRDQLCLIPNTPHKSVAKGKSEADNVEVFNAGVLPDLAADAKPHWELGEHYGLLNMELGVKLTGSGFPVYMGQGAKLQRALISFFLDRAIAAGYQEVIPPHLVNADSAFGTGALPDKEGQMYHATEDDLYLIPTAEVPITNLYRDMVVAEEQLPIKMAGYTPCFRREAGSYGKDVRGLNRVHQFDKVEIVRIEHPDRSYAGLDEMIEHVKGLLESLELPYRILRLCGGDTSYASALTYDFEVYAGAQKRWLEVSSCSNFETFQTNRLKLRFKDDNKKNRLAHTLNGSALALARIVAALLENNQEDNGIVIPKALVPYTGFERIENK